MAIKPVRCSECGEPCVYEDGSPKPAGTKTCSTACRSRRGRRMKRDAKKGGRQSPHAPEHQDAAVAVRGRVKDAAHEVLKEELRPVVREQMTADVLGGIGHLISMTPRAIALLEQQMESPDEAIAQRAVTLLLKYTLGNPSVAPPPAQQDAAPMQVVFNMPRASDAAPEPAPPADATELRRCGDCGTDKPAAEFVGDSERCLECFAGMKASLKERFGDAYDG